MPNRNLPRDITEEAISKEVQLKMCLLVSSQDLVIKIPVSTYEFVFIMDFFHQKIVRRIKDFRLQLTFRYNCLGIRA